MARGSPRRRRLPVRGLGPRCASPESGARGPEPGHGPRSKAALLRGNARPVSQCGAPTSTELALHWQTGQVAFDNQAEGQLHSRGQSPGPRALWCHERRARPSEVPGKCRWRRRALSQRDSEATSPSTAPQLCQIAGSIDQVTSAVPLSSSLGQSLIS
jgi:hypothetical protein